jgi:site-specific DNA-methyltransferase (adenine-specific)
MKEEFEINKIYNENCIDTMKRMKDNFIDLTVTSPPYDNLRDYNGYTFNFESIAKELFRVTKHGGVVVWVVGDATINGSETGTSFKQALFFKECGFNLHDTMIYKKTGGGARGSKLCYWQNFEYMFVFSKGKPKAINLIYDKINITAGKLNSGVNGRSKKGVKRYKKVTKTAKIGKRENVWCIAAGNNTADDKTQHPAPFPEKLANDHIISWSNKKDLIYDPFTGSGTTAKMCIRNKRNFIGSELSVEYCDIANKRIEETKKIIALEKTQIKLF